MKPKWTDALTSEVYDRLCSCTTIRSDLHDLVNAKWTWFKKNGRDKQGFTKEDALVSVLELLDCNSIYIDLTVDEYNELKGD